MPVPVRLAYARQVKSQEPEGFAPQPIHHPGFLQVQLDAQGRDLFPKPLQSAFRPAPFGMVSTDGDDTIIGEPMMVDCLVAPFCRFAADRVEEPVNLAQIDVRRQAGPFSGCAALAGSGGFGGQDWEFGRDVEFELGVGLAERRLDFGGVLGSGEEEAEIG
jgi:hypothetical protein